LLALAVCAGAFAEQSTPYILTEFPLVAMGADSKIWVKWTGASSKTNIMEYPADERYPDSGKMYFSKSPGGSAIENYTDSVTVFVLDTTDSTVIAGGETLYNTVFQNNIAFQGIPPQRGICFRPADQPNMGPGMYYFMVAWRATITQELPGGLTAEKDTVFFSNELQMIVESDQAPELVSPGLDADISDLTPTFSWKKNPGVPYYHIIVSDEKISADLENESIEGLSIVWQAITANTSLTYGAPDPSQTITADPPPVSPGETYSWVVLNNYGNHPAYTSKKFGLPQTFNVLGEPLAKPVSTGPADGDTIDALADSLVFRWTNLDSRANTFKIYIYVASDFEGVDAQLVVWEDEVMADADQETDTMSLTVDAADVLTNNYYTWKVIAVDSRGGGTAGDLSGFTFKGVSMGNLKVQTRENITIGDSTLVKNVAAVKIEVEVLEGSMEAPLLFYTDNNGNLSRERPAGSYRITAVKDGFEEASRTVTIEEDATENVTLYLERPASTMYGKLLDGSQRPIDLGTVVAVSDRGDTIRAESDALGNFVLNCYNADWSVWASKKGYVAAQPLDTSVAAGQNLNLKTFVLERNAYVLSGTVVNEKGDPLIGANVKLLREGAVIDEKPATAQDGAFSFSVEPGTYAISATKTGFSAKQTSLDVFGSKQVSVTLASGASLVKGRIYGSTWGDAGRVYAPITNATVRFIDSSASPADTFETVSDWAYGDYQISLPGSMEGKEYVMYAAGEGFIGRMRQQPVLARSGKTQTVNDTIAGLASVNGTVSRSEDGKAIGGVEVVLLDTATGAIALSARSDAQGYFELRGIADGAYAVRAGKESYTLDSIHLLDTGSTVVRDSIIDIVDGRAVKIGAEALIIETIQVKLAPGEKSLFWLARHSGMPVSDASVKIESPLRKTMRLGDTLSGVGPGAYIVTIDADADSILDCVRRTTTIPDTEDTIYVDTVPLPVAHASLESLSVQSGAITLRAASTVELDSIRMSYRGDDATKIDSLVADSITESGGRYWYWFTCAPRKTGAMLVYYFEAYLGDAVYGYDKETFRAFIRPDTTTLSRIMVDPGGDDTLAVAADATIAFTFQGYYGSRFVRDTRLSDKDVSWSLRNAQGCRFKGNNPASAEGLTVTLTTPSSRADSVVTVIAMLDTSRRDIASGLSPEVRVPLRVKGSLDSVFVKRVDSDELYVTTASSDRAEFVAQGITAEGERVAVSAQWRIHPENAGAISAHGVFDPSSRFVGRVAVVAAIGDVTGYFNAQTGSDVNESGLAVHYFIPMHADSVTNHEGLTIVFPDSVVGPNDEAEVKLATPLLKNRMYRSPSDSGFLMIGKGYDIDELNDVAFRIDKDSIQLKLDIPEEYQADAAQDAAAFTVGRWNPDSIRWEPLDGATVLREGTLISVNVAHFSRYAVMFRKETVAGELRVFPNPFSPYIRPVNRYGDGYTTDLPFGACFEITPKAMVDPLDVRLDIYNIKGEHVVFARLINPEPNRQYHLWWDGRTSREFNKEVYAEKIGNNELRQVMVTENGPMCRNGRYFAVLTVKDGEGNISRKMVQTVLIK
jgi:hypothetical protein